MTDRERLAGLPLAGLKVVDLSSGPAGGIATMELADFGARVIRYHDAEYAYLNDMPSARMWLRGKTTGTDLGQDLADADVLVVSRPHGFAGADYATVKTMNPRLIYLEISAWGEDSALPPYEPVVAAKAGRMQNMAGIIADSGPHYAAVPVATHATAQNVVSGVLAALYQRLHDGGGQLIRTSLLQGIMPYDMGQSLFLQVRPDREPLDVSRLLPSLNYHPVQCADGRWLQLGNLLPHLFENFMRVVGLRDLMAELPDNLEKVRDRILETLQTRSRDEWMDLFVQDGGVAAHPYLTAAEALADLDMTMNGHVVEIDGVKQLGPVATLTRTPAVVTGDAKPGSGFDWSGSGEASNSGRLPLAGVTIVELATIIASPLGASFLADMGARVIKVEAVGGDPFRHMGGGIGATRCNQGKESISVDLKSAEGQRIVRELAHRADMLIHNYRPGVPERLGIGYDDLRDGNPRLVYLSANGYGPNGPGATRPSTHPIPGAAMGGAGYQAGGTVDDLLPIGELREAARRLMRANEVNPDPNTAVVVVAASLMGLLARESVGVGQQIFVDMFGANAYANFDDMVSFADKPERPSLGAELRGPRPLYRLYPAKSGWVFLGIRSEKEWRCFCEITGHVQVEDPFVIESQALTDSLTALFQTRDASGWELLLAPQGLGCVQADACNTGEFFLGECHEDSRWMVSVRHEEFGEYYRHRPMVEFATPNTALQAGVRTGVDAEPLLTEIGYSRSEVANLFERGILFSADRQEL